MLSIYLKRKRLRERQNHWRQKEVVEKKTKNEFNWPICKKQYFDIENKINIFKKTIFLYNDEKNKLFS